MKVAKIIQEAIVSFFSGELNQQDADQLLSWINEVEENRKYFDELREVWFTEGLIYPLKSNPEEAFSEITTRIRERGYRPIPGRALRIRLASLIRIAAAAIIVVLIGYATFSILKKPKEIIAVSNYFEATAPKGSKSYITMPDGTEIWLNADTRLRYNNEFGRSNRDVYLDGEAYFRVNKEKHNHFKVYTSDICITVVGTSFNVKSYLEEETIETTLAEGLAHLEIQEEESKSKRNSRVILAPNQIAIFKKQTSKTDDLSQRLVINEVADLQMYISWKDGKWVIKNKKLGDLASILERRYDMHIHFMADEIENYVVTATFMDESLEQVLQAISLITPIRFEVKGKEIYLYEDEELRNQYKGVLNHNGL